MYVEVWIEKASTASNIDIPWRFTGKERDDETGLYYYGARYLDSKTARWLSADPALGDYIPGVPVDDEARKRNQSLPGMGGVFNMVNLHLYHYAGNNPVKYVDPDGKIVITISISGSAHAGLGIQGSIAMGISKEEGFDIGLYANGSIIGSGPLLSAGLGVTFGLNFEAKKSMILMGFQVPWAEE
jgi:RHS repeat-associated protein